MHPLNGKIFLNEKTSSLIWTKGAEMHTQFQAFSKKFFEKIYPFTCSHWEAPNYRVFMKNFLSGKKPSHLFGIAKPNDTLFHRKIRKYFFGCRCFILLPSKSLFTYSHWEHSNAHPESQKIFTHSLIWNWEVKTQPVFQKNGKKICPPRLAGTLSILKI